MKSGSANSYVRMSLVLFIVVDDVPKVSWTGSLAGISVLSILS